VQDTPVKQGLERRQKSQLYQVCLAACPQFMLL